MGSIDCDAHAILDSPDNEYSSDIETAKQLKILKTN